MPHFLDLPRNSSLEGGVPILSGWYADASGMALDEMRLVIPETGELAYLHTHRPDVESLFPGHSVIGFTTVLDRRHWTRDSLNVNIQINGAQAGQMPITIQPGAAEAIQAVLKARAAKRSWCLEAARCPRCKGRDLQQDEALLRCLRCGERYPQNGGALNLLSSEVYGSLDPRHAAATSANSYDFTAQAIIEMTRDAGGMVLDCGAGLRPDPNERVVNLEIGDYPSTDVLGVGDNLPFQDCVFDAVLSITVLEHVRDPFTCARELVRVLKPGGQLYVVVPFLQPLHGYPHHFFNISGEGLRTLFPDLVITDHRVDFTGLPIYALHWIIQQYAAHLPPTTRERFLSMTFRELLAKQPEQHAADPIASDLSEEGKWILASQTYLLLRK